MKKLFVLVRADLPLNYGAVQAGHAVAEFVLNRPNSWSNEILIYLKVKSLFQMQIIRDRFVKEKIDFIEFKEPDLNNEITAIATTHENNIIKKLNLLKS